MRKRGQLVGLLAIVTVYLALLGRSVTYDFVWDDVREIQTNTSFDRPLLDGLGTTQTERTDPTLTELTSIELAYDSYRPVLFTSYWIDIQLWGRSPFALHAVNVLLGVLAILLAYALSRRWLGGTLALIPTALFALHPLQIEAVAYVSGRGDLLAGVFALLATLAAIRAGDATERPRAALWMTASCIAFACSLFSKEAYIGLPIALALIAYIDRTLRRSWWMPASLLAVCGVYFVVRSAIVTATSGGALADAMRVMPSVWLEYARLVVLPFDLSTERLPRPALVPIGWIVVAAIAVVMLYRRFAKRPALGAQLRSAVAGVVWMALLVAPSAVAIASMNVVADRYFYLSMLGLGIALTAAGAHVAALQPRYRRPLLITAAVWGVLALVVAWTQVPVWRDTATLYRHAVEMSPNSSKAQYRVGFLDAQAGRWDEAIARFERAIELDPHNVPALNNLGVAYLRVRQLPRAERALAAAVASNPAHFRSWLNLGLAQLEQGNRAGCAAIQRALEINPRYEAARVEQQRRCSAGR